MLAPMMDFEDLLLVSFLLSFVDFVALAILVIYITVQSSQGNSQ